MNEMDLTFRKIIFSNKYTFFEHSKMLFDGLDVYHQHTINSGLQHVGRF